VIIIYAYNVLMVHTPKLFLVRKVIKWFSMKILYKVIVLLVDHVLKLYNINVLIQDVIVIISVIFVSLSYLYHQNNQDNPQFNTQHLFKMIHIN